MLNFDLKLKILQEFHSQSDFALFLKANESIISKVVRGRREISDSEKRRWAKALKCTVGEVFPESVEQVA